MRRGLRGGSRLGLQQKGVLGQRPRAGRQRGPWCRRGSAGRPGDASRRKEGAPCDRVGSARGFLWLALTREQGQKPQGSCHLGRFATETTVQPPEGSVRTAADSPRSEEAAGLHAGFRAGRGGLRGRAPSGHQPCHRPRVRPRRTREARVRRGPLLSCTDLGRKGPARTRRAPARGVRWGQRRGRGRGGATRGTRHTTAGGSVGGALRLPQKTPHNSDADERDQGHVQCPSLVPRENSELLLKQECVRPPRNKNRHFCFHLKMFCPSLSFFLFHLVSTVRFFAALTA